MASHYPAICVLAPFFTAMVVALAASARPRLGFPVALTGICLGLIASAFMLGDVARTGTEVYYFGGWMPPMGIELRVDGINALLALTINIVALFACLYSSGRSKERIANKISQFYTLFLLLITGLQGITLTGDAFNVFVLVEVASLTSYGLIAMGSAKRGTLAAFNYVIMGTIGASFYLLGVGYLYIKCGSLNMADLREIIAQGDLYNSPSIKVAFILMILGVWIKMAFFPLHGWLSNAYTYCPSSAANILAPLVTKVSVYLMLRIMLGVFGIEFLQAHLDWGHIVVWLAVFAILAGSALALAQTELKKMLCYLIVAEVGYMVGGAWLGNETGMVGTAYHIISDAFMTLCLFLAAGLFYRQFRTHSIDQLAAGLRQMPFTALAFFIGGAAMIGIPPTCGFFSKWYLVRAGLEAGHLGYVIALLISSLVNAVLFIRIFEKTYFPKEVNEGGDVPPHLHPLEEAKAAAEGHDDHHAHDHHPEPVKITEAPPMMLAPLLASAILLIAIGLLNTPITSIIKTALHPYFH